MKNERVLPGNRGKRSSIEGGLHLHPGHLEVLRHLAIIPAGDETATRGEGNESADSSSDNAAGENFNSLAAVSALRETLDSANQIVEAMIRASLLTGARPRTTLWVQVDECEKRTADLSYRVTLLRRALSR